MNDIVFRRIGGRIVPMKRKQKEGIAQIGAGAAVTAGSAVYAAKQVEKANFAFGRSANLRGASKLAMGKTQTYSRLIKESATFKLLGKKFARKGFGVLALGVAAGTALATAGSKKIVTGTKDEKAAKTAAITGAVTGFGLSVFGARAKLGNIVKLSKNLNPKKPVSGLFHLYSKDGIKRSSSTVNKYAGATYKGVKPKAASVYDAKQQDMFSTKKKFNINKWIKGF